ncbi:MAG: ATP-binding protein [Gemmatimonadales bacterium]|nr:ATP-binding protein [Gemmatimonadales bacterium]
MTDPFASLVPDPATRAAVAAARMVAESPRGHLLLLITGARGSGKTHLLRAIRDRAAGATPPRQVELVTLGRLAEHVQSRGLADAGVALRDRLLRAEIVLLDDLEVIERQLAVQAFVFDVLESRLAAGLATVVTAARGLSQLTGLDARLVRRLRDASTVEIGLPGPAARAQILDQRITEAGHNLLPGVVTALAEAELGSVKEYLGALNRILAVQETTPTPIPVDDALALVGLERTVPVPGHDGGVESQGYAAGEFDEFLTEVVANVSEQFDHWRGRLRDAVALWQGAGMRTGRLERLLADEGPGDPEPVLEAFERDANELVRLAAEVAALAPDLAGADLLRDPDQLVAARRLVNEARTRRAPLSAPLPDLTLATIGTGASNRVALETLAAIVAEPGARHNPLVLAGPSGVGKTHLLHGLGNALAHRGLAPIACLSAHSLLGELSSLSTPEETAQWRARYQWVAALLIDDIHLLANEPRAHAELLQIYAALEEGGRPMVFTSSRALSDLAGFDPRLLNRLEGGTVVDVRSPDREVRLAVVRSLLAGTPAANDVGLIDYLAGRPADSVRAVQGIVHRVLVEAEAAHTIASAALARETLDTVEGKAPRRERRPIGARSGILSPGMGVVRSPEKMVQVWPVAGERLLTELG